MESANVKYDEYIEVYEVEPMKELEEYKSFVYVYAGMPTEEDATNQVTNQKEVSVTVESHTMNAKLHLGIRYIQMLSYKMKLKHIIILRLVEMLSYLTKMYKMILKLKYQMKKQELNQDYPDL